MAEVNRARRRAVQQDAPASLSPNEHRVFARDGEPVMVAGKRIVLGVLTLYGTIRVRDYLQQMAVDGGVFGRADETTGHLMVNAAIVTNNWAPMTGLFDLICAAPWPCDLELDADAEELANVVDMFFEHSGLNWLEAVLKNSAAARWVRMDQLVGTFMQDAMETALAGVSLEPISPVETLAPSTESS